MKRLKKYDYYNFVKTPVECLHTFSYSNNIFVKLESQNLNGNIKSRTAYFILKNIERNCNITNIVESSSGNLGLSLGYFAKEMNLNFLCLVDPSVPIEKIQQLEKNNIIYESVELKDFNDYRTARINYAKELGAKAGWFWTNQYANSSNTEAHYVTTGPELFEQLKGNIDIFVCSVGTGGTISGIAQYLKEQNKAIEIVAVEPSGSTIFGGEPRKYLTAGAGLDAPSKLLIKNIKNIDYYAKVDDSDAIKTCLELLQKEKIFVGITSGSVLFVSKYLSELYPDKNIACVCPDGGELYNDIFLKYKIEQTDTYPQIIPLKRIRYEKV